jgi:hypothetical protein
MSWRFAYWATFIATMGVYMAMVIWTLPAIATAAGGLAVFDMRPTGYSPQEARAFLAALTDEGRALYLGPQRLLDLFYPAMLAVVLGGAIWVLVRFAWLRRVLLAIVLGGMLADYWENALVKDLLETPGPVSDAAILAASRATMAKSALTGLAMTAVLVALVAAFFRTRRAA